MKNTCSQCEAGKNAYTVQILAKAMAPHSISIGCLPSWMDEAGTADHSIYDKGIYSESQYGKHPWPLPRRMRMAGHAGQRRTRGQAC